MMVSSSNQKKTALGKYISEVMPIKQLLRSQKIWGIKPRNKEQQFLMDALMDPDIQVVTVIGKAGSGKTICAIAAGLEQTIDETTAQYSRVIVSRPVQPLGKDIGFLPGTLEEGVCDWVSTRLCPLNASRLRAGRLSAACFATGGMELDVELLIPGAPDTLAIEIGYSASILLRGEEDVPIDPLRVFDVRAGMSNCDLSAARKKAYYGVAFLIVDRITERTGLEGIHTLCQRAQAQGMDEAPAEWFLTAAGLRNADAATWRAAFHDALGARDLRELLAMYPSLLTDTLDRIGGREFPGLGAKRVQARITVGGADECVELQLVLDR